MRVRAGGFTLIELLVTLTLVSVIALVTVPLYEVTAIRIKEAELRVALRQIRTALDAYKDAADGGLVKKDVGESGFPPSLKVLVEGVDTVQAQGNLTTAPSGPTRMMFLRQVPRDPFTPDPTVPPEEQWDTRAYGSPPSDPQPGKDVYDVMSKSTTVGSNGIAYKDW
jgi:general secretion pathway protein G